MNTDLLHSGPHSGADAAPRARLPIRFLRYLIERFSLFSIVPACVIQYMFIAHYAGSPLRLSEWSHWLAEGSLPSALPWARLEAATWLAVGSWPSAPPWARLEAATWLAVGSWPSAPPWARLEAATWLTGFATYLGVFLLLRLLDDMKDKGHDDLFYAERPVQRGLVTLGELSAIAVVLLLGLTLANLLFSTTAGVWFFFATLGYVALMRVEFFAPAFVRPRLLLYLALHEVFVPLLVAYVIYHQGGALGGARDLLFLVLSLLMVMAVEVARKIRPSTLDRTGRDTYSAYLGRRGALAFLGLILTGAQILFSTVAGTSVWLGLLLLAPLAASLYYYRSDGSRSAKLILGATVLFLTGNMLAAL